MKNTKTQENTQETVEALTREVGLQVRAIRSRRGLTRKNLAFHSDVSERYLAQLERGEANISLGLLWRIAKALGVQIESLLPTDEQAVIQYEPLGEMLGSLSREEQEKACHLLRDAFSAHHDSYKGVAFIGLRGAGKTTLGELLAKHYKVPFVRLNSVVSRLAGMDMNELVSLTGQAVYRRLELQALQQTIADYRYVVLETGGSLVSEAETYQLLRKSFFTVWLSASPEEHMQRVIEQGDMRPMSGNRQAAMTDLRLILDERNSQYDLANYHHVTSGKSVQQSAEELIGLCGPYLSAN